MKDYIKLLRIEQWVKNLFIFLPLVFSGNILNVKLFSESIFAFFIFSLTASSIYIINDYTDIEADREHPEKRNRPLASGAISKQNALVLLVGVIALCVTLVVISSKIFNYNVTSFCATILTYFILNLFYTFKLKQVAIVDIFIISIGFVLRVLAGGYITNIPISQWSVLLTFALALVLAIGKRRGELINLEDGKKTRKALEGYNVQFADIALSISCTLAIVCYAMFTLSPEAQRKFNSRVFYTVIFVVFAFLRYLQQTLVFNRTESPTKIIYKDRYIQVTLVLWLASFIYTIYY